MNPLDNQIILAFVTGLTAGGISCVALQGGLLASSLSTTTSKYQATFSFLVSKIISHVIFGALLGLLGSIITITPTARGWLQIALAIYLVGVAFSILDLHPFFRYFIFTPPKFLARFIRQQSQASNIATPALMGALTVFIPCAATQAMSVVALSTGNPLTAAALLGAFTVGTTPPFLVLGWLYQKFQQAYSKYFHAMAFVVMIFMSLYSLNNALTLLGSIYTFSNFVEAAVNPRPNSAVAATLSGNSQAITINVTDAGYSPRNINLKSGVKTKLILQTDHTQGCSLSFTIPTLNLSKLLPSTGTETLEFTPSTKGPLVFSCSMGMYSGVFNVI